MVYLPPKFDSGKENTDVFPTKNENGKKKLTKNFTTCNLLM